MRNLLLLTMLCVSCGKVKVEADDVRGDVYVDDGYIKMIEFCDDRYGKDTPDALECIEDGKEYRKLKVGVEGTVDIPLFCSTSSDPEACESDLEELEDTGILGDLLGALGDE